MTVSILSARAFAYLQRFCVAWENFGLVSAVRLFVYCRKAAPGGVSLYVRKLGRSIVFRGKIDKGVLSHLYTPGYRIRDTTGNPVRVILDVGANIGDETLRFRHFHPEAVIVAIEPDSENFKILSLNAGDGPKIRLLKSGLWSHDCWLRGIPGESAEGFRVEEADAASPDGVKAVSIPSILGRFSLDEIDILKMDIEGAEYQVFSAPNVKSWIDRVKVLIVECPDTDHPGATQRIFEAIAGREFDCHIHGECLVFIRRDTGWKLESNTYL
jgi:FkbM family methyltransferase